MTPDLQARILEPPTELSISVDDLKLYLRHDPSVAAEEDALLADLIREAEAWVAMRQWRTIMPTKYQATMEDWRWPLELPLPNLLSVEAIEYRNDAGAWTTFSAANYDPLTTATPGLVLLKSGVTLPTLYDTEQPVRVTWIAGYANADAVPELTRAAIRAMARWLYDHRDGMAPPDGICVLADAEAVCKFVGTTSGA